MSERLPGRKARTRINISSLGDNTIISAPTTGHIEIDHYTIHPDGGANTISFLDGLTTMFHFVFDDNQGNTFDSDYNYAIKLSEASDFVLNLSAATSVTGFVLYRVVGEA